MSFDAIKKLAIFPFSNVPNCLLSLINAAGLVVRAASASDFFNPFLIANLKFFRKSLSFSSPEEVIQN